MVSADLIAWLRRLIAESAQTPYTDQNLSDLIEASACNDTEGRLPDHDDWVATYDVWAVASDIWMEKSAMIADEYDFSADGGSFNRSQKVQNALKMASYCKSRSKGLSHQLMQYPKETYLLDDVEDQYA